VIALDPTHPQTPVAAAAGSYRTIFRFMPLPADNAELSLPYFRLEKALRAALAGSPRTTQFMQVRAFDQARLLSEPIKMRDGWLSVEADRADECTRVAMNRLGEVQVSVRRLFEPMAQPPRLVPYQLKRAAACFADLVGRAYAAVNWPVLGRASAELREVGGTQLFYQRGQDWLQIGSCTEEAIDTGDFDFRPWTGGRPFISADVEGVAACVCDLAIHFRSDDGLGIALELNEVSDFIAKAPPP
jgi:hypothetical protein